MKSFPLWTLCMALLHQSAMGQYFRSNFQKAPAIAPNVDPSLTKLSDRTAALVSVMSNNASVISNNSEEEGLHSSEQHDSSSQEDNVNTTLAVGVSATHTSMENGTDAITTQSLGTSTEVLGNASVLSSSTTTGGGEIYWTPKNVVVNGSVPEEEEEVEEVIRGKPSTTESASSTTLPPETIYQKTLALINDTYTLSILLPVGAGIVFASTIIVTVAACRCMSRRCRRRRLRKKVLPDSVKNFRPSDKARLLTESSDEEF